MFDGMYTLSLANTHQKPTWAPDELGLLRSTYVTGDRLAIVVYSRDEETDVIELYTDLTVNLIGNPEVVDYPNVDWSRTAWVRGSQNYLLDACVEAGIAEITATSCFGIGHETAYLVEFDIEQIPEMPME